MQIYDIYDDLWMNSYTLSHLLNFIMDLGGLNPRSMGLLTGIYLQGWQFSSVLMKHS
jgi:hypothetical protein